MTNFGTCGLGCNSPPSFVPTEQPLSLSLSPVARETLHIRRSLPIPVTNAFVKIFLNGTDGGLGDKNGKRRLLALQPAIERNVAASSSNLDFYSILLACQAPQVSLRVHISEALQYLEMVGDRTVLLPCLFIMVTECGLKYFQKKHKFTGIERKFEGHDSIFYVSLLHVLHSLLYIVLLKSRRKGA